MIQANNLFRQKADELRQMVARVKGLIAQNRVDEAFLILMDYDKSVVEENQIIALQNRWQQNERSYTILRQIPLSEYNPERNSIVGALLRVADLLTESIEQPPPSKDYKLSLADEANLERIVGPKSKLIEMKWLKKAFDVSKSVGRITVTKRKNDREWTEFGTGFLTPGGYLFTNHHVLANPEEAAGAKVEFNYMEGEEISEYKFDHTTWIGTNENKLDFARVKVKDGGRVPLANWGFLEIDESGDVRENDPLPIIQHPEGGGMQIALETDSVLRIDGPQIYYQTDTLGGSSGSPVFNKDWKVIALHSAGMRLEKANRGILFSAIMRYLAEAGPVAPRPSKEQANDESTDESVVKESAARNTPGPLRIFWMYDESAANYADGLKLFFTPLEKKGVVRIFDMHKHIGFGEKEKVIKENLAQSDLIMCLITPLFLATALSYAEEAYGMKKSVVPVLMEDTPIEDLFLGRLFSLPTRHKNVAAWLTHGSNLQAAYMDIYVKIKQYIDDITKQDGTR